MLEHRFYHEVLGPFIRFRARAAENVCVQTANNDIIVLAQEAATAAYHFPEAVRGLAPWGSAAEILHQKLGDVVDSRKHGVLTRNRGSVSGADRQVVLQAALSYEVNDADEFSYLGTLVWAENKRFGLFELGETIGSFIHDIRQELSISIGIPQLNLPTYGFSKKIITYVTDKTFFVQNTTLNFSKRTTDGSLIPAHPKNVHFEVQEITLTPRP